MERNIHTFRRESRLELDEVTLEIDGEEYQHPGLSLRFSGTLN